MSKTKVSGAGARYGMVMALNSDGLPLPQDASATPVQGTLVQGIKALTVTDPTPRRFTHFGDDDGFAHDSLPPNEAGAYDFTTAVTNLDLNAMVEGGIVRTINSNKMAGGNTNNRGNEPLMMFAAYRQALDVDKTSLTFGKLRQWEMRLYPSSRISKQTDGFESENTDKAYTATPTRVKYTPWNEKLTESIWGFTEAEYIEIITDYHPRINVYRGDGTITAFELSHPPFDSNQLTVWVDGTLTAPSAVNVSSTNPAFTLGAAAAVTKQVFALIETDEPGDT